jgi:hypothetical protein
MAPEIISPIAQRVSTFKYREEGPRRFEFFQYDISLISYVHDDIMILLNVSDRYMFPRGRSKPRMAMVIAFSVLYHSLFGNVQHLRAKVFIISRLKRHLVCSTLQVAFQYKQVLKINLGLDIGPRK